MPRELRVNVGDMVYHVLNRANGRMRLFETEGDYRAFEKVLLEAHEQVAMRTLAYCVMPNHWHLVLWPREDGDLSVFMHWLTLTHTQRWHMAHETTGTGHIYQARFKSFPVESDRHYLTVCRYVERNALRAGLASRAEDWPWGSLARRLSGNPDLTAMLSPGPRPWPDGWAEMVNSGQSDEEEQTLRKCATHERPFGSAFWVRTTCRRLGIPETIRPRGRPKKG